MTRTDHTFIESCIGCLINSQSSSPAPALTLKQVVNEFSFFLDYIDKYSVRQKHLQAITRGQ